VAERATSLSSPVRFDDPSRSFPFFSFGVRSSASPPVNSVYRDHHHSIQNPITEIEQGKKCPYLVLERPGAALTYERRLQSIRKSVHDRILIQEVDFAFRRMNVHVHRTRINMKAVGGCGSKWYSPFALTRSQLLPEIDEREGAFG
jgi:hypothetical protein